MLNETPLVTIRDRVLLLRSFPAFAALDDETLTLMAEHSRRRAFRAGEVVASEGAPLESAYMVIEGQITVHRKGRRTAVVTRGGGVGNLSILARDPHGISAVADVDTLTAESPAWAMNEALDRSFPMLRNSLRLVTGGLVRKRGHLPCRPEDAPPVELGTWPEHPATIVDHLLATRSSAGIFASANLDALLANARAIREVRFEPGESLWQLGEPSSWWTRIAYGSVRCTSADGRFVDVGRNFMLGIMDAYAQMPRSYEARTNTRVVGYRTELEDGLATLEDYPELARGLVAGVAMAVLETRTE
jgi:CRP-like cAMP-binding protein